MSNWRGKLIQYVTNILCNSIIKDVVIPESWIIHEKKGVNLGMHFNITSSYQTKYAKYLKIW